MIPRVAIAAFFVITAGCASDPPPRIYLLSNPSDASVSSTSLVNVSHRLQLAPVLLPDYLDNTELLLRDGPNGLTARSAGRWGERLSKGITDALGAALTTRLPMSEVTFDPAINRSSRQIAVDINSFDVWSDGRCVLSANWVISPGDTKAAVINGRGVYFIPAISQPLRVGDSELVLAMSKAIGKLADSIALETENPIAANVEAIK